MKYCLKRKKGILIGKTKVVNRFRSGYGTESKNKVCQDYWKNLLSFSWL
jgi:hypothetical protein